MDVTSVMSGAAPTAVGKAAIVSDYDTFLHLLTTQMQNQDPLNPIDSSDYAVQLATFSGVEQQTLTNDLLAAMQAQLGQFGLGQMAGWVGQEARGVMPVAVQDAGPVTLLAEPQAGADRAVMVVRDAQGTVVNRVDLLPQTAEFAWSPVDIAGYALPDGLYDITLESYLGEDRLTTAPLASYARIAEVQAEGAAIWLVMEGGAKIPASAITGLRG